MADVENIKPVQPARGLDLQKTAGQLDVALARLRFGAEIAAFVLPPAKAFIKYVKYQRKDSDG